VGIGIALLVAGALLTVLVYFGLWTRVRPPIAFAAIIACGLVLGAGALLVQDGVSAAEWALTLAALTALGPVHGRLVFGRPGART
jgi:hypothetical protein